MPKFEITAYEIVPRTRVYSGKTQEEAVEKMAAWEEGQRELGKEFSAGYMVYSKEAPE